MDKLHEKWMRLAIQEAQKGYGFVSPNPLVGAVIVKEGKILGKGYHHQCGMPHAEVEAVRDAEANGYSCEGAEIYVRKVAPLGDPVEITVRGYELSLRKEDAKMILVD
jgi:pyrimidine deaminase RibD-like protein